MNALRRPVAPNVAAAAPPQHRPRRCRHARRDTGRATAGQDLGNDGAGDHRAGECHAGACTSANQSATRGFVYLQFANQPASLYGVDLDGQLPLGSGGRGEFGLRGQLAYVRGASSPAWGVAVPGAGRSIDMPPPAAIALRGEMVDLLGALRQVFALSGDGKNSEAADLAEKLIGRSAMGSHGGSMPPGMFMPPEMRAMAQGLHQNGSDWAFALRTNDRQRADQAFAQVLGSCVGCHQSFQLRRP